MNTMLFQLEISQLINELCQIANTTNITILEFNALDVSRIREKIITIATTIENEDKHLYSQLFRAKDFLFYTNAYRKVMINPVVLGEIIFGLQYLFAKLQTKKTVTVQESEIWTYIHPLIKNSSKQLFMNGHYSNAAEDAYIEINDRVKKLFALTKPGNKIPDGSAVMNTVFSANDPLVKFCDIGTETGENKQKGYMQMLAGAMSALRNPKAHSNSELVSAEEAYRRLATASMLMYAIDEGVKYSGIEEYKRDNNG